MLFLLNSASFLDVIPDSNVVVVITEQKFIAGGNGTSSISRSIDGINWTGIGNTVFQSNCTSIGYSSTLNRVIAIGDNANNYTIVYSNDEGLSWNIAENSLSIFDNTYFSSVIWSPKLNIFVAGSSATNNSLAWSADGIQWTGIGTSIFTYGCSGICWSADKNIFVAVGNKTRTGINTLAWSADGKNWTGLGNTYGEYGSMVVYSSVKKLFVATFNSSNFCGVAYSSDGKIWNSAVKGTIFNDNFGSGIATNGSLFAIGGAYANNTLAYTNDAKSFTGLGTNIYRYRCDTIDYSPQLSIFVSGANRGNTSAYSYDGKSWFLTNSTIFTSFTLCITALK